MILSKKLSYR